MDFHGFDVKIEEINPSTGKNVFDVNFTLNEECYQFMYYPNNLEDCWFSDFPPEFEDLDYDTVSIDFGKSVKHYLLVKGLKGDAKEAWSDILS